MNTIYSCSFYCVNVKNRREGRNKILALSILYLLNPGYGYEVDIGKYSDKLIKRLIEKYPDIVGSVGKTDDLTIEVAGLGTGENRLNKNMIEKAVCNMLIEVVDRRCDRRYFVFSSSAEWNKVALNIALLADGRNQGYAASEDQIKELDPLKLTDKAKKQLVETINRGTDLRKNVAISRASIGYPDEMGYVEKICGYLYPHNVIGYDIDILGNISMPIKEIRRAFSDPIRNIPGKIWLLLDNQMKFDSSISLSQFHLYRIRWSGKDLDPMSMDVLYNDERIVDWSEVSNLKHSNSVRTTAGIECIEEIFHKK